jgi:hypothetical protein
MYNEKLKKDVRTILHKCVGRENRITREQIANLLLMESSNDNNDIVARSIRLAIQALRQDGYLILSSASVNGYWLAATKEEVDEVVLELYHRSDEIRKQASCLQTSAEKRFGLQIKLF